MSWLKRRRPLIARDDCGTDRICRCDLRSLMVFKHTNDTTIPGYEAQKAASFHSEQRTLSRFGSVFSIHLDLYLFYSTYILCPCCLQKTSVRETTEQLSARPVYSIAACIPWMALLVSCKGLDVSLRQRLVCRQALHSRCDLCMILHMIEVDRRMWQWAVWIIWIKPFSSLSLVVQKLYKLKLKAVQ